MPQNLTAVGNTLFLSGISPTSPMGNQLLKTDGITVLIVKDLEFLGETAGSLPANFTNVNGSLFFSGQNSAASGRQIWKSNGTDVGTIQMTNTVFGFSVGEMDHVNGTVFFAGVVNEPIQNSAGHKLFRLNSPNNVTEFNTAGTGNLTAFENQMVFTQGGQFQTELSRANVVGNGITTLQIYSSSGHPANLTVANATLFFVAGTAANGRELWKFKANSASMVQDFIVGATDASITNLCARGSDVFFASNGTGGNELRMSKGTPNAIATVRNIGQAGSFPKEFVKMGNFTFFSADDGVSGRELWKTDGTIGNAVRVADLIPGTTGSNPTNLIVITNGAVQTLFFEAKTAINGRELFKLENTAGAVPICISNIGTGAANAGIGNMTNVNGTLHFTATQNLPNLGDRIWKVNAFRTEVDQTGGAMTFANNLKAMGSTLFFTQSPQVGPRTLNKLGLPNPIKTFATVAGQADPIPQELTVIGSRLFFTAADGAISRRVWVTNAAATSVSQVSSRNASELTNFNGRLVFTDYFGNIAGQKAIFRVNTAFNGADTIATDLSIGGLEAAGTTLFYFQATHNGRLWLKKITTTNFQPAELKEFPEGNTVIAIETIVAGNNLFFIMNAAATGHELYKSNGTVTGIVSDIRPGVGNSNAHALAVCGTDLFFSANNLTNGQEPWKLANATALDDDGSDERDAVLEVMEIPTSEVPEIKVYPNPAANFVNVDLPENDLTGTLSILSASGQLVRSVQSTEGETSVQMDLQDLQKGVYMVRWVQSDEQVVVKKLIIQ
ncbi:MAG: T9SS type A sorting domain-containing protein [Lewinellaceae bacterium]|nr:T9SS type A sorting domain-containing protein [Lewinellaceae bacterium]